MLASRSRLTLSLSLLFSIAPLFAAQAPAKKDASQPPGVAARAALGQVANATPPSAIKVAPGFKVDLLYTVPKEEQGSWVALTIDHKGRLIAGDQYGSLYRITLPGTNSTAGTKVERLAVTLPSVSTKPDYNADMKEDTPKKGNKAAAELPAIGAHGLLYAFDSLYVMVGEVANKRGLWRLRDTDGDDQYDQVEFLREMKGGGEHGPHSLALSPDGKSIYFANGNHTDLPEHLDTSRPVRWDEDHLLPRMWDARGHAKNKYSPGGYIARTDPAGKSVELFAIGFRNQFDLAFDQNGELHTYDSDMEWDQGTPWYVPTRINHVVDAGDYGWQSQRRRALLCRRRPAHPGCALPRDLRRQRADRPRQTCRPHAGSEAPSRTRGPARRGHQPGRNRRPLAAPRSLRPFCPLGRPHGLGAADPRQLGGPRAE